MRKPVLIAVALVAVVGAVTVFAGSVGATNRGLGDWGQRICKAVTLRTPGQCGGDRSPIAKEVPPATIIGRVEIARDVPAKQCWVFLEGGRKKGAPCDADGVFQLKNVPPGPWFIRIEIGPSAGIEPYYVFVPTFPGETAVVREIVARPGAVTGRVRGLTEEQRANAVVLVPGLGLVSLVNEHGRYVLNGVPEGTNTVELRVLGALAKTPTTRTVTVPAFGLATGINFDLSKPNSPGNQNIKPIQGKGG